MSKIKVTCTPIIMTSVQRQQRGVAAGRAMADLAPEGPHSLESLDVEEEVEQRILRYQLREIEDPAPPLHYLDYDVDEHLLHTTVPDPIRIRGVGGTTMSVLFAFVLRCSKTHYVHCRFGLSNRFDEEFPQSLVGKVSRAAS